MDELRKKIRSICTHYSELGEGTAGYDLSEEQFQKLFDLYAQSQTELISKIKATKQTWTHSHTFNTPEAKPCRACFRDVIIDEIINSLEAEAQKGNTK